MSTHRIKPPKTPRSARRKSRSRRGPASHIVIPGLSAYLMKGPAENADSN